MKYAFSQISRVIPGVLAYDAQFCYNDLIRTILGKLQIHHTPLLMAVFLLLILGMYHAGELAVYGDKEEAGILGGPASAREGASEEMTLYAMAPNISMPSPQDGADRGSQVQSAQSSHLSLLPAMLANHPAITGTVIPQLAVLKYVVAKGDTLKKIAAKFKITEATIVGANPAIKGKKKLRAGAELSILPVSGVLYTVKDTDAVEQIAEKFKTSPDAIAKLNPGVNITKLEQGSILIVPTDALPASFVLAMESPKRTVSSHVQLARPTEGFNWSKLHSHNAVDIANSCGVPVVASADGIVVPDDKLGDGTTEWSGGYGHFVLIEHQENVRTRYAHLKDIDVQVGDYVKKGQKIGTIGKTGEATGCHLHFEVYGAENPLAKQ